MGKTEIKWQIFASCSTSTQVYLQYRRGSVRLLNVYNEDTESDSVEEPENEQTTKHQPALTTSTGLLLLFPDFILAL